MRRRLLVLVVAACVIAVGGEWRGLDRAVGGEQSAPSKPAAQAAEPTPVVVVWHFGGRRPDSRIKSGAAFVLWSDGLVFRNWPRTADSVGVACRIDDEESKALTHATDRVVAGSYRLTPDSSWFRIVRNGRFEADSEERVDVGAGDMETDPPRLGIEARPPRQLAQMIEGTCKEPDGALLDEAQRRLKTIDVSAKKK